VNITPLASYLYIHLWAKVKYKPVIIPPVIPTNNPSIASNSLIALLDTITPPAITPCYKIYKSSFYFNINEILIKPIIEANRLIIT